MTHAVEPPEQRPVGAPAAQPVETGAPRGGGAARNRRVLVGVVGLAVAAAVAGWVAGGRIRSPADVAADAEAPPPSNITVPVTEMVISRDVVARGTVEFSEATEITVGGGVEGTSAVVTRLGVEQGSLLDEGAMTVEVTGRPLFALVGELPMFRDIVPGAEGDDVTQLEEALVRLGFDPGPVDGIYDQAAQAAVNEWYVQAGYDALGPTEAERAQLDDAGRNVTAARGQLSGAEQALAEARAPLPESQRLQLDGAVRQAENGRADIQAQANAAQAEADAGVAAARQAVDAARQTQTVADQRLAEAIAGTDPDDPSLPATPELVAALTAEADAARSATESAEADVVAAEAGAESVRAQFQVQLDDAQLQVDIAVAARAEASAGADTTALQAAVDDAARAVTDAEASLDRLQSDIGISVPQSEVLFVPTLPRRVDQVLVDRGDVANGPVMSISGAELIVSSAVSANDRQFVREGATAVVEDDALGVRLEGTVERLADRPGTDGAAEGRFHVRIALPATDRADEIRGLNMRVTIPVESTAGEVLAVPLAALSAGADGTTRVEVEESDGTVRTVIVALGLDDGSMAEVSPTGGGLAAGDQVVVGTAGQLTDTDTDTDTETDTDTDTETDTSTEPAPTTDGRPAGDGSGSEAGRAATQAGEAA